MMGEYFMWESSETFATTDIRDITPVGACGWVEVTTFSDAERQYIPGLGNGSHIKKCGYCGSHSTDARGNCGACGAPL